MDHLPASNILCNPNNFPFPTSSRAPFFHANPYNRKCCISSNSRIGPYGPHAFYLMQKPKSSMAKNNRYQPMLPEFDTISAPPVRPDGSMKPSENQSQEVLPRESSESKSTSTNDLEKLSAALHSDAVPAQGNRPTPTPVRSKIEPGDVVFLIDSHSLIYQLFHAMPPMTSPSGFPVSIIHGFLRDLADIRDRWSPAFIVCTFDESEETFRNELYPAYKEHRDPMPEDLRSQIPLLQTALSATGFPVVSMAGFEADDLLATLAAEVESHGGNAVLVTSDKDCRQLLTDRTRMLNLRKNEYFDASHLQEVWGIRPEQVVDFQAMVGDSVDNVPGIPLIGPKIAQELLAKFGTLENILDRADEVPGAKRSENVRNFKDQALLSKKLVELRRDVPIHADWQSWRKLRANQREVKELFEKFGFRKLAARFLEESSAPPDVSAKVEKHYVLIESTSQLQEIVDSWIGIQKIAFDSETTSTNPRSAATVGYSLAWKPGHAIYIPILAPRGEVTLPIEEVLQILRPVLENPSIAKVGQNLKYDWIILGNDGVHLQGIAFDTMVADYLLDAGQRNHGLEDIARRWLGKESIGIVDLIGSGKSQKTMDQVPLSLITEYACEDVDLPLQLDPILSASLEEQDLAELFRSLELPLVEVLAEMEFQGISLDVERLQELSREFDLRIQSMLVEISGMAGDKFNPDSPKQLADVLFNRLGLPVIKKTKTGPSTDVEVLQELADKHPLPAKIIEYRQATKLKGTYIDALPELLCPTTQRIHTSFRQDVAATGRLSSSDPNLQNIPVRTEDGRRIRSAFRAGPLGWLLLTADYSQIELRVLAHYCQDASLRTAFEEDRDIHSMVASQVYDVPIDQVNSAMRRSAKAINFGIIYGQSPFGLAKALSITKEEAGAFIDSYFARYPGVQDFIVHTIDECKKMGYVKTLSGRKRWLSGVRDFSSLEPSKRKMLTEPERMAVNTVIQGSAADMIKMAMISIHRKLKNSDLQSKMLLQIHDELIFEFPLSEREALTDLVRSEMTTVCPLSVPLKVDVKTGPNWAACEPSQ